jgi:hypothetical protein
MCRVFQRHQGTVVQREGDFDGDGKTDIAVFSRSMPQ